MKSDAVLASLSMDLKRAALSYYRHSYHTADRFLKEVLKRKKELDTQELAPYLQKILNEIGTSSQTFTQDTAEDFLMFSALIQNAVIKSSEVGFTE